MSMFRTMIAAGIAACALAASPAFAADEEVQVYMDELNAPGELGLDMHVNDVLSGHNPADYTGQEPSLHRWRITPEFSLGLSRQLELGLYLPLATIAPDGTPRAEGAKARLKWLAPHGEQGFYWGANLEVGRVAHALDENPWNGEFKLIGGWRRGPWVAAVNGNFDFVISGPTGGPATLKLGTKLAYHLTPAATLGIESYNGMGPLRSLGSLSQNEHATYLALDTKLGRWDLNAGIGRGYGSNADETIVKLVIGVPIGLSLAR